MEWCTNCKKDVEVIEVECVDIYSGDPNDDMTYLEIHCKQCENLLGGFL